MQLSAKHADSSNNIREFSRFVVVGFSNFAISFSVFYLLYNYWKLSTLFYGLLGEGGKTLADSIARLGADSLDATLANVVGYGAGVANSFIWNKLWTFKVKHDAAAQFCRFLVLNVSCLVLSSASLFLFTDLLGWPYLPIWFVTMGFVTLINYALSKYWVFTNNDF